MCRHSWPQASSHLFPFLCPLEPLGVPWAQTPKPGIRMLSSALPHPLPQPFSEARAWPGWDWPASLSRTRCPRPPALPRAGPLTSLSEAGAALRVHLLPWALADHSFCKKSAAHTGLRVLLSPECVCMRVWV